MHKKIDISIFLKILSFSFKSKQIVCSQKTGIAMSYEETSKIMTSIQPYEQIGVRERVALQVIHNLSSKQFNYAITGTIIIIILLLSDHTIQQIIVSTFSATISAHYEFYDSGFRSAFSNLTIVIWQSQKFKWSVLLSFCPQLPFKREPDTGSFKQLFFLNLRIPDSTTDIFGQNVTMMTVACIITIVLIILFVFFMQFSFSIKIYCKIAFLRCIIPLDGYRLFEWKIFQEIYTNCHKVSFPGGRCPLTLPTK